MYQPPLLDDFHALAYLFITKVCDKKYNDDPIFTTKLT